MADLHRQALALLDLLRAEGYALEAAEDGGFVPSADLPDALDARLAAFVGAGGAAAGSEARRALSAVLRAGTRAAREVLSLPVAMAVLGVKYNVGFARKGRGALFTTSREVYEDSKHSCAVFTAGDLKLAALALEIGRTGPLHFDRWLLAKERKPGPLTVEQVGLHVPDLRGDPTPHSTFGELFDGYGLDMQGCELLSEPGSEAAA